MNTVIKCTLVCVPPMHILEGLCLLYLLVCGTTYLMLHWLMCHRANRHSQQSILCQIVWSIRSTEASWTTLSPRRQYIQIYADHVQYFLTSPKPSLATIEDKRLYCHVCVQPMNNYMHIFLQCELCFLYSQHRHIVLPNMEMDYKIYVCIMIRG